MQDPGVATYMPLSRLDEAGRPSFEVELRPLITRGPDGRIVDLKAREPRHSLSDRFCKKMASVIRRGTSPFKRQPTPVPVAGSRFFID